MIALNATPELRLTFEKLIQTMEVKVKWNGLFVVIDNTMILQGDVRSLFFHFDSRKVVTNLIDLDIPMQKITPIENNPYVKNVINMLLYAFGKWGNIKGLTVEKDYQQLCRLFSSILGELEIEAEYTKEHFWFYQKGVRVVYEDVMQAAIDHKEKDPEIKENEHKGLWHKLIWQHIFSDFPMRETTAKERNKNRLGNNFYLTGYTCPDCKAKMHGVVYPVGQEFIIDTNEGRVRIARAYTCSKCYHFYTPRPRRLLIDGDSYIMDFEGDEAAYEDYMELLGKNGAKVCNPNYNTYVDKQSTFKPNSVNGAMAQKAAENDALEELQEMLEEIDDLPMREFEHFFAKVGEGFFPEKEIELVEKALWKKREARLKGEKTTGGIKGYEKKSRESKTQEEKTDKAKTAETFQNEKENAAAKEKTERYKVRLNLFPRLSERQRNELIRQISSDSTISGQVRSELLERAKELKHKDVFEKLKEKIANAKNKNPLVMLRVYDEIVKADLEEPQRQELLIMTGLSPQDYKEYLASKEEAPGLPEENEARQKIGSLGRTKTGVYQSEKTVDIRGNWSEKDGKQRDNKGVFLRKNHFGESVSLKNGSGEEHSKEDDSVRQEKKGGRPESPNRSAINKAADIREIEAMIRRSKSTSREDLQQLWEELLEQDFDQEVLEPYEEYVKSQIRRLDEEYLDSLLGDMMDLSSDEGVEIYEQIKEANILPELKTNALKQLEKRLSRIKAEECELLVQKLKKEMGEAGLTELERHHYYPAKKVIMKEATAEETAVADYAKASYGAGLGPFEYPIWVVDTTRNRSGEKGMFLTPEYIYYSNLTTSYHISVFAIEKIGALTGLLNRGLYAYQKNGDKTKLPYAVETAELPKLAEVLDSFVKYLQEKPFSRKEVYLAKETHDEICCFRCGHVYRWTDTCPKCGYKANQ